MSYLKKIFECAGLVVKNLTGKPLNNNVNGRRDWVALGDYLAAAWACRWVLTKADGPLRLLLYVLCHDCT